MLSLVVKGIGSVRETGDGRSLLQVQPACTDELHGSNAGDRVQVVRGGERVLAGQRIGRVRDSGSTDRPETPARPWGVQERTDTATAPLS